MRSTHLKPGRHLHIGGTCRSEGWEVLNALPGPFVDHVGNANDLRAFPSGSFTAVYASHVLEHFDYVGEIDRVLAEWFRVLEPGGQLFISVPDLETLARLFLDKENLNDDERFLVSRMIFGGHTDAYDFHQSGLSEDILTRFLRNAGFEAITRVGHFGLFDDTSNLELKRVPISLNMEALKPLDSDPAPTEHPVADTPTKASGAASPAESAGDLSLAPGSSWSHGYFSGATYTASFYVELAPHRLDFSALVKGHRSPRPQPGAAFRYLELGSGMGFGLCLLAAAHPEGTFVGVDFLPDHIAHSQWLVRELGLNNVRFLEADFLALEKDPRPLDPTEPGEAKGFHYVVAHGIAAWVSEPVQQALLSLASNQLRPGGLFYCSYNTYPGWFGRSSFHMLACLERRINQPSSPLKALENARSALKTLASMGLPLGRCLPHLGAELDGIGAVQNKAYLLGEFGPEHWKPLYVAEMHGRCQEHKLTFLATASLPELFEELLPEPSRSLVAKETNPTLHQALFDLAINQSFRRDIFVKGPLPLRKHQRQQALGELSITLVTTQPATQVRIKTSFNEVELNATLTGAIESALAEGPCTIGDLYLPMGLDLDDLLRTLALMIHHGRIDLHRGVAAAASASSALAVNRRLRDLMQEGHIYGFLVAPAIGSALGCSPLEALVLETIEQGLDDETAIGLVLMGLDAIDGHFNDAAGLPITDPQRQVEALSTYLTEFRETSWPKLQLLGAIQAPSNLEEGH